MSLTIWDLLVVWLAPPLACGGGMLLASLLLYAFISGPVPSALKDDFSVKVSLKQRLRSGAMARWSFVYFLGLLLLDNGFQATVLYRLSHSLAVRGLRMPAAVVHALAKALTHIDVSPYASIGPGLVFYHGLGAVVGKNSEIGREVTLCQGITTGAGRPRIGNSVFIGAGAKVLGNVYIGDGAIIGANAVVITDVPPDCVAVGIPATRFLPKSTDQ